MCRDDLIEVVEVALARWVMDAQQRGASSLAQWLKLMGTYGAAASSGLPGARLSFGAHLFGTLCWSIKGASCLWWGLAREKKIKHTPGEKKKRLVLLLKTNIASNNSGDRKLRGKWQLLHLCWAFFLAVCLVKSCWSVDWCAQWLLCSPLKKKKKKSPKFGKRGKSVASSEDASVFNFGWISVYFLPPRLHFQLVTWTENKAPVATDDNNIYTRDASLVDHCETFYSPQLSFFPN